MNPELEKMIKETLRISRENKEMITKMYRNQKRERFWRVVKMILIIGLMLGAYYIIAPFVDNLTNAYDSMLESFQKIQNANPFNFGGSN